MCKKIFPLMLVLLFVLITSQNVAGQELRIGLIPGSGNEAGGDDVAFARAGIEYEKIDANGYTLANLSKYDVIAIDVVAYDGNPDLKANYTIVNQYVYNGGYLVTVDYQQDNSWKTAYLPYSLTLFDDDITNSREAALADHPLFDFPNKITAEKHFAANLWGNNLYFADGPHEATGKWQVLATDVQSGWPLIVGAGYGDGYIVFSALRTLQSVSNSDKQEVNEFLQNLLLWRFYDTHPGIARSPYPLNGQTDVFNTENFSWVPGTDVVKHYVFIGTDYNDVNEATIAEPLSTTVSEALDVNSFDPGLLELETTHYWRVDEVLSSSEVVKGMIWKFTVENAALEMLPGSIIKVTGISSASKSDANDTANGSGLGVDANFPDQHDNGSGSWASSGTDDPNKVWIQYDFDKQYRIHQMLVWNYNQRFATNKGFKDVLVQYSEDGDTWIDIPEITKFDKAPDSPDYDVHDSNNVFDCNDVLSKSVRITALSNYGGKAYGLSEVSFTYIPVWPMNLSPADDATDVAFDTKLTWRRGREALIHNLYFDTNEANVENRNVTPIPLEVTRYSPVLRLGKTYYWLVDEINLEMTPSVWSSEVMSFKTPSTILIEGFETGYGNTIGTDTVFDTWLDGAVDSSNGAWMGRDSAPYLHTINHSGGHSAPMKYNNESYSYSEVTADTSKLQNDSDWSRGLPSTLTIWFRGDSNTVEVGDLELYCKIGGQTIVYGGSLDVLMTDMWRQFDINLDTLGVDLSNIPTITIGIKKVGSKGSQGVIYLDDIMLTGNEAVIAYPEILVEAEDFNTILSPMEVNDTIATASGGKCIHVKNGTPASTDNPPTGGIVTYEVDLDGGQYVISGRVTIASTTADSFWVKVEGAESNQPIHESGWCRWNLIQTGANWHWDEVHSYQDDNSIPTVTWTIPAGTTTISIAYRESDAANPPKLDALMIQKVGN